MSDDRMEATPRTVIAATEASAGGANGTDHAEREIVRSPAGNGRLIYLMGASGSGKDSLLNWLMTALPSTGPVRIARRAITRASSVNESALALTSEAFRLRRDAGEFALYWHSHGLDYGIGVEIDDWMDRGDVVIVNGSRGYLPAAWRRYPALEAVEIVVSRDTLKQRLLARGRETPAEIDARLVRAAAAFPLPEGCRITRIHNDAALETAGQALLDLVTRAIQPPAAPVAHG